MTKNEFLVRMHDIMNNVHFLTELYNDNACSLTTYYTVRDKLLTECDAIRISYFSDENPTREVLSKEEMNYVFGRAYHE